MARAAVLESFEKFEAVKDVFDDVKWGIMWWAGFGNLGNSLILCVEHSAYSSQYSFWRGLFDVVPKP